MRHVECFFDRIPSSDKRRTFKGVPEFSYAVFPEFMLDEFKHGVSEVIIRRSGQWITGKKHARFCEFRCPVVEGCIAHDQERPGIPDIGVVLAPPFHDPARRKAQGICPPSRAPEKKVKLENMRELVGNKSLELIKSQVSIDDDPVEDGL